MNIFSTLQVYAGKWSVKSTRDFDDEEIALVEHAVVVSSSYGNSVQFTLKAGGLTFIPLDNSSTLGVGETVDNRCVHHSSSAPDGVLQYAICYIIINN